MVNDPIADMLIQIKNAALAGKPFVDLPYSKIKFAVAGILAKEGYVQSIEHAEGYRLKILLKYQDNTSVITDVKRMSKPGLRLYVNKHNIPQVVGGMGIAIVSTPKGIMTGKEAKKRGLGGELLCKIW